ncbi:hypothetical protein C8R43DRAFT_943516 [Mycena crocata]|nr:hypothetical protein C8R43DRAFT_943516 [Mycena crocata]
MNRTLHSTLTGLALVVHARSLWTAIGAGEWTSQFDAINQYLNERCQEPSSRSAATIAQVCRMFDSIYLSVTNTTSANFGDPLVRQLLNYCLRPIDRRRVFAFFTIPVLEIFLARRISSRAPIRTQLRAKDSLFSKREVPYSISPISRGIFRALVLLSCQILLAAGVGDLS